MAAPSPSIIETRYAQMFPKLDAAELKRLCRFGERRSYAAGEMLARAGEVGPGLFVILSGEVVITESGDFAKGEPIVTHGPGSFSGELAQLSGRPALAHAKAKNAVDVLVIAPDRLRNVMVQEA